MTLIKTFLAILVASFLGIWGVFRWYGSDLPDLYELQATLKRPSIAVFDEKGTLLATYGDLYGDPIRVEQLPEHVIHAFLATEDRRFYDHIGVDIWGLLRAAWANYQAGAIVQGGSTITQQLAKNFLMAKKFYTYTDRSLRRKIQEAILALRFETLLTKNQILSLYLNRAYFGGGSFGIDGAALRYFGRRATKLSLYESAVLAGLLKAPSRFSPSSHPVLAHQRARQVLQRMVEGRFISESAMQAALVMRSPPPDISSGNSVHYFTDWVVDTLPQFVPDQDQDLKVVTTIDLSLQKLAEEKASKVMEVYGQKWNAEQIALVSMKPDGAVKAILGGLDYRKSNFNRTTQALRQPGSAFKFFIYLAAFQKGWTPDTEISDQAFSVGNWKPKNYRYDEQGSVTLRYAFAKSVNAAAIRLAMHIGVPYLIEVAHHLGLTNPLPPNLTVALGTGETTPLELTGCFATIANGGLRTIPYGIVRVTTQKGKELYRHVPSQEQVLHPEVVLMMRDIMQHVMDDGTGRRNKLDRPCGAKTGTTQHYHDVWFVGYTSDYVTGVWCGCDQKRSLTRQPGGSPATHLWGDFMRAVHHKLPVRPLPRPFGFHTISSAYLQRGGRTPVEPETAVDELEKMEEKNKNALDRIFEHLF